MGFYNQATNTPAARTGRPGDAMARIPNLAFLDIISAPLASCNEKGVTSAILVATRLNDMACAQTAIGR
jgi:hypothetical protein